MLVALASWRASAASRVAARGVILIISEPERAQNLPFEKRRIDWSYALALAELMTCHSLAFNSFNIINLCSEHKGFLLDYYYSNSRDH